MDLAKYRTLFLEEATEHLAEIGRALFVLEKDPGASEALEQVFRMTHSMKGMGASLGYEAVSGLSHLLEDQLGAYRERGGIDDVEALPLLFRGLASLEQMVEAVRVGDESPVEDTELMAAFKAHRGAPPPKKAAGRAGLRR